jgi:CRISPR-associated protein Cmr3
MMENWIEISFRDPVVSRDGRPFGNGQGKRMRSAGWPMPSVIAGSLRSAVGKHAGREFSDRTGADLLEMEVAGGLPVAATGGGTELYFPAPQDCVLRPESAAALAARPMEVDDGGGCDFPHSALRPVMLTRQDAADDFKPANAPAWWPERKFVDWMLGNEVMFDSSFLTAPLADERTHVHIQPQSGAATEGELFSTTALALGCLPRYKTVPEGGITGRYSVARFAVRVRGSGWCAQAAADMDSLHPLGGERRLADWKACQLPLWKCPDAISRALATANRVRMVLATPAIFSDGWKPGWLDKDLTGRVPGTQVDLRLVGVAIKRWQSVSGWSLAAPRGPKAIRRVVPAGGVYFFEVLSSGAGELTTRWLEPVSDSVQECRDGFGLATWGIW